jgi:hypothetical protein
VSLLWPERIEITLQPHVLSIRRGGSERRIEADPPHGSEPWHGVTSVLQSEAGTWRLERLRVNVVVSGPLVRYLLVPEPEGDPTPDEEEALAYFHLTRVHGERAREWEVRLAKIGKGPRVACAIDRELLREIKACFAPPSRCRLVSMQPGLAVAYNEWRTRLPREGAWLVLDESGQTCIALLAGGGLRALYVTRGAIEWRDLLERERLRTAGAELPGAVLVNGALQALPIAA